MLKKFKLDKFNQNVGKLLSGTIIAQIIPLVMSPLLTRLYSPQEFGVLSLFIAFTATIGAVSNGKYELAILLPESKRDALNIAFLSLIISGFISVILGLLIFVVEIINIEQYISNFLNIDSISWIYYVPFSVFILGSYNVFYYYNLREKYYSHIAKANIIKAISLGVLQLTLCLTKVSSYGLVLAYLLSNLMGNFKLISNTIKGFSLLDLSIDKIKILAKRYNNFPKFSVPGTLTNQFSYYLLNIFIPVLYSISTLGYYALVERILGMPAAVIGKSIGDVYYNEAMSEKNTTGYTVKTFLSTLKKMIVISLVPFLVLFFFAEELIIFLFGKNWGDAGGMLRIMLPLFLIRFIVNPLSMTHNIFEKQRILLIWQVVLLITGLIVIFSSYINSLPFMLFLKILTLLYSFMYLVHGVLLYLESIGKI